MASLCDLLYAFDSTLLNELSTFPPAFGRKRIPRFVELLREIVGRQLTVSRESHARVEQTIRTKIESLEAKCRQTNRQFLRKWLMIARSGHPQELKEVMKTMLTEKRDFEVECLRLLKELEQEWREFGVACVESVA